ncbi:Hypothetical predicted protein [Marmota monax]|uniref:Uncharacterized protein n=1 Tax=Marmota monax TaxID=9995 RepID=A0A5E4CCY6_MARMO|nr:Hypothetical predicted protein [Marmota monax]
MKPRPAAFVDNKLKQRIIQFGFGHGVCRQLYSFEGETWLSLTTVGGRVEFA